jgi:site-specific DNA recombinase
MTDESRRNQAVIYVRVSSKEQTNGYSLSDQERICRGWCASHEHKYEVLRVFAELGESAKTKKRTQLTAMLAFIKANQKQLAAVVVYSLDRLSRDTRDFLDLKDTILDDDLTLRYASQNFDDTPEGRCHETEVAARAQCDNEVRGQRCRIGMVSAVEAGRTCWVAPLGYRNSRDKNAPSLIVDSLETAALIRRSYELVDAGYSAPKALHQMTLEGLQTRKGKPMRHKSFFEMLSNKTYAGFVHGCGIVVHGKFEPIVDEDLFERVQLRLHRHPEATAAQYQRVNPDFPLRGTVRCPMCGHLLTASSSTGHGGKYGYYSCTQCKHSGVRSVVLENLFSKQLHRLDFKPEVVTFLRIALEANLDQQKKWGQKSSQDLAKKLTELADLSKGALEKCIKGIISDSLAKEYVDDIEGQMADVREQMESVRDSVLVTDDVLRTGLSVLGHMDSFWKSCDVTAKQEFQRFLFPTGMTIGQDGFGTSQTALCIRHREVSALVKGNVVAAGGVEPSTLRV